MSNIVGKRYSAFAYLVFVCLLPERATAYSALSHGVMAEQAVVSLEDGEAQIVYNLGFQPLESADLLPVSPGGEQIVRDRSPLENVVVGAINEDNVHEVIDGKKVASRRPIQHFFNPQVTCYDDKVCNGLFGKITASPDWVFENPTLWGSGLISNSMDEQLFSYQDARRYQACALLPKDDGTCDVPGQKAENDFDRRRANAGYLFQSLGHIVHHIQDMAQPQHVRLDSHYHSGNVERGDPSWIGTEHDDAEVLETTLNAFLFNIGALVISWKIHEPSRYEALAVDEVRRQVESGVIDAYPAYVSGVVAPQDFWSNQFETGIADITSRTFPSAETQYALVKTEAFKESGDLRDLDVTRYEGEIADFVDLPMPNGAGAQIHREEVTTKDGADGYAYYIADSFLDPNTNEWVDVDRMSRIGLFTRRVGRHIETRFKLPGLHAHETDETIADHLAVLVPRAVGYSKAFLEYFFRGRLSFSLAWSQDQQAFIPTVENVTPSETMIGEFTVVRIAGNGDTKALLSMPAWLPAQGSIQLSPVEADALLPTDRLGILFQGSLGAEQNNVTTATTSVPITTVDIVVRKVGFKHEIVNLGDVPFSGTVTLLLGGTPLTDHASGNSTFTVDLQPGESLGGLDISIGEGAKLEVRADGVSGENRAVIKEPFQYVAGLSACAGAVSVRGGSDGFSDVFDLGEVAGNVCITFDAKAMLDQMKVYLGPDNVYDTGMIYGTAARAVHYDPDADGTQELKIQVLANENPGTRWRLSVSCPREEIDCNEHDYDDRDYEAIDIGLYNSDAYCFPEVAAYVDGEKLWEGTAYYQHHVRALLASGEKHKFKLEILSGDNSIFCRSPLGVTVMAGAYPLYLAADGTFAVP